MRNLKIHLVRAQNILCFGPDGIEVHFTDYGNVVQVRGINLDYPYCEDDPHASSNAAGKSSLQELLSIGFFGRTVKWPTKNRGGEIINCLSDKGEIEVQWDDYRLLRSFSRSKTGTISSKLKLWKSPNRIWDKTSLVDRPTGALEAEISRAVALSHHAFCNVVIFDDSSTYSFLEADTPKKREIVENLLDLDQYREYHENAKNVLKDLKKKVASLATEYDRLQGDVTVAERRVMTVQQQETNWRAAKNVEVKNLEARIATKQQELQATDTGAQLDNWQKAQERVTQLTSEITDLEAKRDRVQEAIKVARDKVQTAREDRNTIAETAQQHQLALKEANATLQQALKLASTLEGMNDGATCPYCYGVINRENYGPALVNARHTADECRQKIVTESASLESQKERYENKKISIGVMEEKIREAEGKVAVLEAKVRKNRQEVSQLAALPKPEGTVAEQVLEAEIVELRKQVEARRTEMEGVSPYKEIIEQAEAEKAQKETDRDKKAGELKAAEEEVPYYQFWVEAFGDNGIRKFVIDGIIPALNERIAYWMQILIEGKIELTFNNTLEPTITRNGNPARYYMMSNGERRRLNLAVTQAFAYVMMLNSGSCPSLVFLDEITGGGIDRAGISGIYNMVFELAKERQVFVTTHNENLMSLLQGCETVTLKKENDITVLVS